MLSTTPTASETRAAYDRTLVARFVATGDEAAFTEIVQFYRGRVLANIWPRYVSNKCDAEEVQADVFIRAYKGLAAFRHESSLFTWLCTIAHNMASNRYHYNMRRRVDRHLSLECEYANACTLQEFLTDPNQAHVSQIIDLRHTEEKAAACLHRLSDKQRAVFVLSVEQHVPYKEIAVRLGIREGTVKSVLARARTNLKRLVMPDAIQRRVA